MDYELHSRQYRQDHFTVVNDAVPETMARACRDLYLNSPYDRHEQTREKHYTHVFATDDERLPRPDEIYLAKFYRSIEAEKSPLIAELVDQHLRPMVEKVAGVKCDKGFDGRALKLVPGDYVRFHVDDYNASVGFIFYMSERWQWDWGGILQIAATPSSEVHSLMPQFNQLAIIDHGRHMPHSISVVAEYAMEDRFALAGFFK